MKNMTIAKMLFAVPLVCLLASCDPFGNNNRIQEPAPAQADGWKPVYAKQNEANKIEGQEAREIEKGGKIYVKGHMLYQVEVGRGIHVIDIQNASSPQKVKFIQVTGATEVSIKDNYLYTNNVNDLVVLNIADINNVRVENRMADVFHLVDPALPPTAGYFECVDASKGVVVGWEPTTIQNPVCRKN